MSGSPLPLDPLAEARRQCEHGWEAAADGMAAVTSVMRAQQILLPADGRRTLVNLRPAGRELAVAATEQLNERVFRALGVHSDHTTALVDVLTELRKGAGDFSPPSVRPRARR